MFYIRISFLCFISFIGILIIVPSFALADQETIIKSWLERIEKSGATVTYVSLETTGYLSVLDDLTITVDHNDSTDKIFIDDLVFEKIKKPNDDAFQAGLIQLSSISVESENLAITIDKVLIEDLDLPQLLDIAQLTRLHDQQDTLQVINVMGAFYDVLGDISSSELSISGLNIISVDEDLLFSFKKLGFYNWTNGLLDFYRLEDLTFKNQDDLAEPFSISLKEVRTDQIDFRAFRNIWLPKYYSAVKAGMWKQIVKQSFLSELIIETPESKIFVESIKSGATKIRPANAALLDLFNDLVLLDEQVLHDPLEIIAPLYEIYDSFTLGQIEAKNISVDNQKEGFIGKLETYKLGPFSLENGIEIIAFEKIQVTKDGHNIFQIGSYGFGDIKFPPKQAILELQGREIEDVDQVLKILPTLGGVFITQVDIDIPEHVADTEIEFQMDALRVEFPDYIGAIPSHLKIILDDLRMPENFLVQADADLQQILQGLKLNEVVYNLNLELDYDIDTRSLALIDSFMDLENFGRLEANVTIGGIPVSIFESPDIFSLGSIAFTGNLSQAELAFIDKGGTNRVFAAAAEEQRVEIPDLKDAFLLQIPSILHQLDRPQFSLKFQDKIRDFLENPNRIMVALGTQTPLSMLQINAAYLEGPRALVDLLEPTIEIK